MAAGARRTIMSVVDPASSIQAGDVLRTTFTDDLGIQPRRRRLPLRKAASSASALALRKASSWTARGSRTSIIRSIMHKKTPVWNARCLCAICSCSLASQSRPSSILLVFCASRRRRYFCVSGSSAELCAGRAALLGCGGSPAIVEGRGRSPRAFLSDERSAVAPRWLRCSCSFCCLLVCYMPLAIAIFLPGFTALVLSARDLNCRQYCRDSSFHRCALRLHVVI